MGSSFKFNDISTEDLGLVIQAPPSYIFPTRNVSSVEIPGRNGELYIDNKSYKQVERSYTIGAAVKKGHSVYDDAGRVIEWLNSTKGHYYRLEDSYDPEVFRLAAYISSGTVTNYYDQAYAFNISFRCRPERFLKSGEVPVLSNTSNFTIENPTEYEAKPIITVTIPNEYLGFDKVLLMSINDKESVVSFNVSTEEAEKHTPLRVTLDSEDMTVFDENQNEFGSYVSTNGKEFPLLNGGVSEIKLATYEKIDKNYDSYQHYIDEYITENNGYVKSDYKPYDAVVSEKSNSITVKSYEQLLISKQESYDAKSLQIQAMNKADSYTFRSFNTYLNEICQYVQVGQDEIDAEIDFSDYGFKVSNDSDGNIVITSSENKYFMLKKDKNIKLNRDGEIIGTIKGTDITTVYCYNTIEVNGSYVLDTDVYTATVPEWLSFEVVYKTIDGKSSPSEIKFSAIRSGYYFFPKTGLFGKDSWKSIVASEASKYVLKSMNWSTNSQAFLKSGTLNPSKTEESTFYSCENDPEYDDIYVYEEDEDGNKIRKLQSKCHFIVEPTDNFTKVNVRIKNDEENHNGWYKYILNDDDEKASDWKYCDSSNDLILSANGTDSFRILYIKENTGEGIDPIDIIDATHIPNYYYPETIDDEGNVTPGWPDWLDPYIKDTNGNIITTLVGMKFTGNSLTKIKMSVKTSGYYRFSVDLTTEETYSDWVHLTENQLLGYEGDVAFDKDVTLVYHVQMLQEDPTTLKFKNNRCFNYGEDDTENPPEWLEVVYSPEDLEDDKTPKSITYKANKKGLYKWDDNTSWVKKDIDEILLTTEGKDVTVFYYMEKKPTYPSDDYVDVNIINDPITDNPKLMQFIVKTPGYYRCNNESYWRYYENKDELLQSEINVENTIYYLDNESSDLEGVTIKIVPRWWRL